MVNRRDVIGAGILMLGGASVRAEPDGDDVDLQLTLTGAIARSGRTQKARSDVTFDLTRRGKLWQSSGWGWAYDYNTADHEATVAVLENEKRLRIDLNVTYGSDPWVPGAAGRYEITLNRNGDRYEGTYRGQFETSKVSGAATAAPRSPFPSLLSGVTPPAPYEHPRLVFRKSDVEQVRERARTPWGQAVVAALRARLKKEPVYQGDFGSDSAYHAAGHAFLHLLTGEAVARDAAREITAQTLRTPPSKGDHQYAYSHHLLGLALAYDFAFDTWDAAFRQTVARYLEDTSALVVAGRGPGFNHSPGSNWIMRTRGGAGVALLALLGDTGNDAPIRRLLAICERSAVRYQTYGMGERGFGAEGDGYHVESLEMLLPFAHALRITQGRDLAGGERGQPLAQSVPIYALRSFPVGGKPTIHRYGRHGEATRETPLALFALGMTSVPPSELPATRGFVDAAGGPSALVVEPHTAPYALALYPEKMPARTLTLPRTLRDERQGFHVFRNQEFVTTLYAKANGGTGWNFPEAGTFRIHGLGTEWAVRSGAGTRDQENVVVVRTPENKAGGTGRVLFYEGSPDGSGAVSLDLSPAYREGREQKDLGIRAERAFLVDYSGRSGAPALFVLADRITGGNGYVWRWHTAGESVTVEEYGFTVKGKDDATLRATFISPVTPRLTVQEASGIHTLSAPVDGPLAEYLVIVTIQHGPAPPVRLTGQGANRAIRVGSQEIRLEFVSQPQNL